MTTDTFVTFGSSNLIDNGSSIRVYVNAMEEKAFRELVQRGANLWPDAPPSMKQFADLITNGKVLQDYTVEVPSPKN